MPHEARKATGRRWHWRRWALLVALLTAVMLLNSPRHWREPDVAHAPATAAGDPTRAGANALSAFPVATVQPVLAGLQRAAGATITAPTRSTIALPPLDTPVASVLTSLRPAADRGDSNAACRVGMELARCNRARRVLGLLQGEYDRAVSSGLPREQISQRQDALAATQRRYTNDLALCAGVANADVSLAWSYLLQAARSGSDAAASYFFTAPPAKAFADDSIALDQWFENREAFRDRGIRSGDVYALNVAATSAISGIGWGGPSRTFARDPYAGAVYTFALIGLASEREAAGLDDVIKDLGAELSSDQLERARAEGEALRRRYFSNTPKVQNASESGTVRPERCAGA